MPRLVTTICLLIAFALALPCAAKETNNEDALPDFVYMFKYDPALNLFLTPKDDVDPHSHPTEVHNYAYAWSVGVARHSKRFTTQTTLTMTHNYNPEQSQPLTQDAAVVFKMQYHWN